jgi:hypothetical protein
VLCANGNTPISLAGLAAASTQPIIGNLAAAGPTMVTNTFIAAVPAPSNFCLPALCSTPSVRVGLPNGCDGFYWGSIAGGLTVSEGQNCLIFGGTVNGSILQIGGNLVVVGSTIKGDVTVLGGGTFSLGAATKIQGSLNVGLLPASSTTNQVCNVNVSGSVTYQLSAAPVDIGSSAACGNTVGGSLYVNATTAPVEADGNTVAGNLECLGNLSITGSGNAAKRKQGQCAGF